MEIRTNLNKDSQWECIQCKGVFRLRDADFTRWTSKDMETGEETFLLDYWYCPYCESEDVENLCDS